MYRYKIIVEYDGTGFAGWQRQNNAPSIQESLEKAIFAFSGETPQIFSAGRTDAGVHAYGQVAHFELSKQFNENTVTNAINFHLKPARIAILHTEQVDENFHARFSAVKRYYCYKIFNRYSPLTLDSNRFWHVTSYLDLKNMQVAARYLCGTNDFSSFRAAQCQALSPIKTLEYIDITRENDKIYFNLAAKSFLHHMVRNIVGTLKMVGTGKISPDSIPDILAAKARSKAGATAPAHGLYFLKVDYL